MSDTPRTDGLTFLAQPGMMPPYNTVPASFARQLERELAEVMKQRDELAKSFQLVWKHLKGERIRHDYITGTKEDGDLKTLQEVCKEALAAVKGGEL